MEILSASRITALHLPRPATEVARAGIRFENKVLSALQLNMDKNIYLERNPWFGYVTSDGEGKICCPDILIWHPRTDGWITVVEVKQTWVPAAFPKLQEIYCPVVEKALKIRTCPLIIVRHLTPDSPKPSSSIIAALKTPTPLIQWLGRGPINL